MIVDWVQKFRNSNNDTFEIHYDDNELDIINKINDALHAHGVQIIDDQTYDNEYMTMKVVTIDPKTEPEYNV